MSASTRRGRGPADPDGTRREQITFPLTIETAGDVVRIPRCCSLTAEVDVFGLWTLAVVTPDRELARIDLLDQAHWSSLKDEDLAQNDLWRWTIAVNDIADLSTPAKLHPGFYQNPADETGRHLGGRGR